MARKELEYVQECCNGEFSIENITRSNFEQFEEIHFEIYKDVKPLHQIESELEFMKQRLETGAWKIEERYPESPEFTEEMFEDMMEKFREDEE